MDKERRHYISVGNVLTMLGFAGAIAASYATLSADNATTRQRITDLEHRNAETRQDLKATGQEIKAEVKEVKGDVKEVKGDVQLILRKLDAIEAVRQAQRKADQK